MCSSDLGSLGFKGVALREVPNINNNNNNKLAKIENVKNTNYSAELILSLILFFIGVIISFLSDDIEKSLRRYKGVYKKYNSLNELCQNVSGLLNDGNVVGWFQGRMEFGPRALGNRSILADPRKPDMQKKLNLKIKYREGFRPFAPAVLKESTQEYFDLSADSPYMLIVSPVNDAIRKPIPKLTGMYERLYTQRSSIPSVTHIDYSARIQTVEENTNNRFYNLLKSFKQNHDCSVLINTSFNVRGEPIVCTPADAYRCFMRTEMDILVLGDYVLHKQDQPKWEDKSNWQEEFKLD